MSELRQKVLAHLAKGNSVVATAKTFSVTQKFIWKAKKLFEETGGYSKRCNGGRPRQVCTKELIRSIKGKVERNPRRSIRKMAKEANTSEASIRRIIKHDLGLRSRAISKVQTLTALQRSKRKERCQLMLSALKKKKTAGKVILFSDEKIFVC